MQLREVIVNLLHNLGSKKEVSKYLHALTRDTQRQRVVIKVGGGILAKQLDELAAAVAFLSHIGVHPVIVHGAGPQLTEELNQSEITSNWIDGQRVTSPEVLSAARKVFQREGHRLADALEQRGVRTRVFTSGVLNAIPATKPELGLVGDIRSVNEDLITSMMDKGTLPIVSPLAETESGQIVNVNADIATREIAIALQAHKIIFLTPTAGLLDHRGHIISAINLAEDFDRLSASDWVQGGMALKLRQIKHLLDDLPPDASISITSPHHLASELFTHKGNGTLIRKGVRVHVHYSTDHIDAPRLIDVVSKSFARPLRSDYLSFNTDRKTIFVAGDYEAVAIVTHNGPAPYLDKFAVSSEAQGIGLAGSLWHKISGECPALFWRSRMENEINPWYTDRADGMVRAGQWKVFWRGISDHAMIDAAVKYAQARPMTLAPILPKRPEAPVGI